MVFIIGRMPVVIKVHLPAHEQSNYHTVEVVITLPKTTKDDMWDEMLSTIHAKDKAANSQYLFESPSKT